MAHPGGNVTGFHNFEPAIGGKWLDLLRQIAPSLRRVAVLHVPGIVPNVAFLRVAQAAAPAFGITVTPAEARNAADIERVLPAFAQDGGGGLIVTPSALTATRRDLIIALAERLGLPAIYSFRSYAASGGLMSYGIDQLELVRAAASYGALGLTVPNFAAALTLRPLSGHCGSAWIHRCDSSVQNDPIRSCDDQFCCDAQSALASGVVACSPRLEGRAYEATRFHHASRRRGNGVAAGGARAAASDGGD